LDSYEILEVLGLGAYAVVRKARHKVNHKEFAVKSYDKTLFCDKNKLENVE
jgi:serine/threonine protein kinase